MKEGSDLTLPGGSGEPRETLGPASSAAASAPPPTPPLGHPRRKYTPPRHRPGLLPPSRGQSGSHSRPTPTPKRCILKELRKRRGGEGITNKWGATAESRGAPHGNAGVIVSGGAPLFSSHHSCRKLQKPLPNKIPFFFGIPTPFHTMTYIPRCSPTCALKPGFASLFMERTRKDSIDWAPAIS